MSYDPTVTRYQHELDNRVILNIGGIRWVPGHRRPSSAVDAVRRTVKRRRLSIESVAIRQRNSRIRFPVPFAPKAFGRIPLARSERRSMLFRSHRLQTMQPQSIERIRNQTASSVPFDELANR